jgi:hypothetical protein
MTKPTIVILLVMANILLLATLLITVAGPAPAFAQAAPLGQNYAIVAAEVRDGVDGVYVIDLSTRRLHVFVPNRNLADRRLLYADYRDLQRDFRGGN